MAQQQSIEKHTIVHRLFAVLAMSVLGILALTDGNVLFAIAPLLFGLLLFVIWQLPLRYWAHLLFFLGLLVDNPTERPGRALYKAWSYPIGELLYLPLERSLKLPGMKATGIEVLLLVLFALTCLKFVWLRAKMTHQAQSQGASVALLLQPFARACLLAVGVMLAWLLWGLARGGAFNYAILQMRALLFLPMMTLFFAAVLRRTGDAKLLLRSIWVVGMLRSLQCIYYYMTVMRFAPQAGGESGDGSYVTTHSDSILAAVLVIMVIVAIYESPSVKHYLWAFCTLPVVGAAIVLNNRRIAFVAIALGLWFAFMTSHRPFQRRVYQTFLVLLPIVLVYVAVGWRAKGGWAKPVQSLRSVIEQKDTSSATRDIENYNLLQTFRRAPLGGSGFGHQYLEIVKAFDISGIFEAYRYVPHNSVLWFWGVMGLLGYTLYGAYLVVGVFMASRLVRLSGETSIRMLGMVAIGCVASYQAQAYGDMGLMSWMGSLLVAALLGSTSTLGLKMGVWSHQHNPLTGGSWRSPTQHLAHVHSHQQGAGL